jgi:DNA-binding NarL/FixJ family response regulator
VLLSEAAHAALRQPIDVRDLGPHQLRGLDSPQRIYQLDASATFPALRADAAEEGLGARLRVVLADDSVLLREGVARLLQDAGFHVVGQAGNADELLLKVRSYTPDVAIVDIRMPPTHTDEGLRAAKEIRERYPGIGVLVLSQYVESGYALDLLQEDANGVGYLLKDRVSDVQEFAAAVKRVAEGGSALDPEVVSRLVGRRRGDDPVSQLTPREREVLELMAEGRSNQAIAERMVVTLRAVEKHVTSIFGKLHLPADEEDHRRVLAVLTYLQQ